MSKDWVDFYAICPATACKDDSPGYWSHDDCGGSMQINRWADMRDDKSSCSSCHKIWDWRFMCGRHTDYRKVSYFKLRNIFSQMTTIPELKTKEYKQFRRDLANTIEDELPEGY